MCHGTQAEPLLSGRFLSFDIGEIKFVPARMLEDACDIHAGGRDLHFAFEKTHGFAEILNPDDLQTFDDRRLGGIVFRHQQPDLVFGPGAQGAW